jgi:ribosomal protein L40E
MLLTCRCGKRFEARRVLPNGRAECPECGRLIDAGQRSTAPRAASAPAPASSEEPAADFDSGLDSKSKKEKRRPLQRRRFRDGDGDGGIDLCDGDSQLARIVALSRRICRLCWAELGRGAQACPHCGAVVKPVSSVDVRFARGSLRAIRNIYLRALFMPFVAAGLGLGLGLALTRLAFIPTRLLGHTTVLALIVAGTFSGAWGLAEYVTRDSKLAQNPILKEKAVRATGFMVGMNGLSFALIMGIVMFLAHQAGFVMGDGGFR